MPCALALHSVEWIVLKAGWTADLQASLRRDMWPPSGPRAPGHTGASFLMPHSGFQWQHPSSPRAPTSHIVLRQTLFAPFSVGEGSVHLPGAPPAVSIVCPARRNNRLPPSHWTSQWEGAEGKNLKGKLSQRHRPVTRRGALDRLQVAIFTGGPALPPVSSPHRQEQPPLPQPSCLSDAE